MKSTRWSWLDRLRRARVTVRLLLFIAPLWYIDGLERLLDRVLNQSCVVCFLLSSLDLYIYIYIYGAIIGNMEYLLRKGMIRICKLSYQVFRVLSKTFIIRLKRINFFSISPDLFEIDWDPCCSGCERSIIRTIVHVDRFRYSKKIKILWLLDRRGLKERKEKKWLERCYLGPGLFAHDTPVSILIPRIDRLSGRDNEGV